jgi:hypothetical protein
VNATFGNFKAEKAVYQMLPWKTGHFIMTFKEINIEDEISVSNLGLLLQGFKRLQEREKLIKQLPSLDSVLVKTNIFQKIMHKRKVTTDAHKFVSLFDGKRTISDIVAESSYDDLKTLDRISKLYQQGFIRPLDSPTKMPDVGESLPEPMQADNSKYEPFENEIHKNEDKSLYRSAEEKEVPIEEDESKLKIRSRFPIEEDFELEDPRSRLKTTEEPDLKEPVILSENKIFEDSSVANGKAKYDETPRRDATANEFASICDELFNKQKIKTGQLVIISSNHQRRKELISAITHGKFTDKTIESSGEQSVEFGKIETPKQRSLEILGVSMETRFLQILEQMSTTIIGYIVLIEAEDSSNLGYMGYLINSMKAKFKVPHLVAVYYPTDQKSIPLAVIRYGLKLDEYEQLVDFDTREVESIKHLLRQLIPPDYSKDSVTDNM